MTPSLLYATGCVLLIAIFFALKYRSRWLAAEQRGSVMLSRVNALEAKVVAHEVVKQTEKARDERMWAGIRGQQMMDEADPGFAFEIAQAVTKAWQDFEDYKLHGTPADIAEIERLQAASRENADKPWLKSKPLYVLLATDDHQAAIGLAASLIVDPPRR